MNLKGFFTELSDPRRDRTKEHDLIDILMIAIVAVICEADDWNMIEEFGKKGAYLASKFSWIKKWNALT